MKGLSIFLNIVLLVAVAILYYLHFSTGTKSGDTSSDVGQKDTTEVVSTSPQNSIAYIQLDSVLKAYTYYSEVEARLMKDQERLGRDLQRREKAFEEGYLKHMEKVQNQTYLTMQRAQDEEQRLTKEQETLMLYKQEVNQELGELQMKYNNEIFDSISDCVNEYNKDKKFDYILESTICIYKDSVNDISDTIIKLLNYRLSIANGGGK